MTDSEKVVAMKAWYKNRQLPAGPIPYAPGQTIVDSGKFVTTQLQAMDISLPRTRMHRNSYMRLYQLKVYLESCPKNA